MIPVNQLMRDARILLQDTDSRRWPVPELLIWINAGGREIATQRPEASVENIPLQLVPGTLQKLPDHATGLLRVIRNLVGGRRPPAERIGRDAVTIIPREVLDTQTPDWHNPDRHPPKKVVDHVVYDEADPRSFYVFPPNSGAGHLEVVISRIPAVVDQTDTPNSVASYSGKHVPVDRAYQNALLDYVLYRAYSKDASFTGDAERAVRYYNAFAGAIGLRQQQGANNPNAQNSNTVPTAPDRSVR